LEQFLFHEPVLRTVENGPATLEELGEAAQRGELSNEEIAAVLTGSPVVASPAYGELDLSRVYSARLGVNAAYRSSRRLSLTMGVGASGYQTEAPIGTSDNRLPLRRTTRLNSDAGLSYRVSQRTDFGLELSAERSRSDFREGRYVSTMLAIKRRVGRHWRIGLQGGAGAADVVHDESFFTGGFVAPEGLNTTWVAGASLEYAGETHSLRLRGNRTVGDRLGLGARSSLAAGLQWRWWRPGTQWGLLADVDWYRSTIAALQPLDSRLFRFGIMRRVGLHQAFLTEYIWGSFSSPFTGVLTSLERQRVQVTYQWSPQEPLQ
jgi:hypothetical protein